MKKTITIITIVFGMAMGLWAQQSGGGLFQRGAMSDEQFYGAGYFNNHEGTTLMPLLPGHNSGNDEDANGPLGSGIAVLLGLGGAYLVANKRKEK